jgi:hypothetical protein
MGHARRASLPSSAPFPLSSQEYFIARPLRITRHPARHQVTAIKIPRGANRPHFSAQMRRQRERRHTSFTRYATPGPIANVCPPRTSDACLSYPTAPGFKNDTRSHAPRPCRYTELAVAAADFLFTSSEDAIPTSTRSRRVLHVSLLRQTLARSSNGVPPDFTLASPAMLGTTAPSFGPSVFQLTGTRSPSVMLQPARRRVVSRLPSTARAPRFKLHSPAQGEHRSSRGKSSPVTLHPAHRRDSRSRLNLPQRAEGLPHQHTSPYFVRLTAHDAPWGSAPPSAPPRLAFGTFLAGRGRTQRTPSPRTHATPACHTQFPHQQTEGAALLSVSLYCHLHCGRTQRTSFQCTLRAHTRAVANTVRTSERKPVALLPASLYHHPRRRGTQHITLHPAPIMEADVVYISDRKV